MIKISVVSTSYNQAAYLDEMLESVRGQHYPSLEHLVRDGGSTDGSVDILRRKSGAAWQHLAWHSQRDNGQSDALNQGFRAATGDVVGWLNSDDRYRPGCLQTIARFFEQNREIDILYGDYTMIDAAGKHLRVRREIEFSRFILFHYRTLCVPPTAAFFRRRIFDEGNFLNESLHYAMDHEFFARLAVRGYRFQHLSSVLADFRIHPASKTGTLPGRQLGESRMTMLTHSPIARRVRSRALRAFCFATFPIAAALARYTEKLLRGFYLPDSFAVRACLVPAHPSTHIGDEPVSGEP